MAQGSVGLRAGFVVLSFLLAGGFVAAVGAATWRLTGDRSAMRRAVVRAALGSAAWLGLTGALALAGRLRFTPFPPTMLGLLASLPVLAIGLAASPVGRRLALGLPLAVLVGFQGFRIAVELLLHRAYVEGLMPIQMSYAGANFDILTGLSAAALGLVLRVREVPRWAVLAWNVAGLGLLLNVLTIAILSSPGPLRRFHAEPSNVWVTRAPWVWLPAVMVLAALLGHLLVFRRLARAGHR
jgi:hypothetical protein